MADQQEIDGSDDDGLGPIVWQGIEALLNDSEIARYLIDGTNRGMNMDETLGENRDPEWWQYHNQMLCDLLHRLMVEIIKPKAN